jgi:hypothetical protein
MARFFRGRVKNSTAAQAGENPRGSLRLNKISGVWLRLESGTRVWSYDVESALRRDGRTLLWPTLIDEFTRECAAIRVAQRPVASSSISGSRASLHLKLS